VAGVVAGALVDHGRGVDRAHLAVHPHGAAGADGRAFPRPGVTAAVGGHDLDLLRAPIVEREVDVDDAVAHAHAATGQVHRTAGPQARVLVQAVAVALPDRPPALARGADPRRPGAQHEVRRVDADVT